MARALAEGPQHVRPFLACFQGWVPVSEVAHVLWVDNTVWRAASEKPHLFRVRIGNVVWISAVGPPTWEEAVGHDVGQPQHRVLVAYACSDSVPCGAVSTMTSCMTIGRLTRPARAESQAQHILPHWLGPDMRSVSGAMHRLLQLPHRLAIP